jgi:hypothetical protein
LTQQACDDAPWFDRVLPSNRLRTLRVRITKELANCISMTRLEVGPEVVGMEHHVVALVSRSDTRQSLEVTGVVFVLAPLELVHLSTSLVVAA